MVGRKAAGTPSVSAPRCASRTVAELKLTVADRALDWDPKQIFNERDSLTCSSTVACGLSPQQALFLRLGNHGAPPLTGCLLGHADEIGHIDACVVQGANLPPPQMHILHVQRDSGRGSRVIESVGETKPTPHPYTHTPGHLFRETVGEGSRVIESVGETWFLVDHTAEQLGPCLEADPTNRAGGESKMLR